MIAFILVSLSKISMDNCYENVLFEIHLRIQSLYVLANLENTQYWLFPKEYLVCYLFIIAIQYSRKELSIEFFHNLHFIIWLK